MGDVEPALGEQLLHVTVAQGEAEIMGWTAPALAEQVAP